MNGNPLQKLILCCSILGIAYSASVRAQDESDSEVVLEEVTVTASRIEQSLQDVPIAVTALTNVDMELRNIDNTRDLQSSIPNISISANTIPVHGSTCSIRSSMTANAGCASCPSNNSPVAAQ